MANGVTILTLGFIALCKNKLFRFISTEVDTGTACLEYAGIQIWTEAKFMTRRSTNDVALTEIQIFTKNTKVEGKLKKRNSGKPPVFIDFPVHYIMLPTIGL